MPLKMLLSHQHNTALFFFFFSLVEYEYPTTSGITGLLHESKEITTEDT